MKKLKVDEAYSILEQSVYGKFLPDIGGKQAFLTELDILKVSYRSPKKALVNCLQYMISRCVKTEGLDPQKSYEEKKVDAEKMMVQLGYKQYIPATERKFLRALYRQNEKLTAKGWKIKNRDRVAFTFDMLSCTAVGLFIGTLSFYGFLAAIILAPLFYAVALIFTSRFADIFNSIKTLLAVWVILFILRIVTVVFFGLK